MRAIHFCGVFAVAVTSLSSFAVDTSDGALMSAGKLAPEQFDELLTKAMKAGNPEQRRFAASLIGVHPFHVTRDRLHSVTRQLMGDRDAVVRLEAVLAVSGFGSYGKQFSEQLDGLTRDPDPRVRKAARTALATLKESK